jgi:hypothetical protein
MAGHAFGGKPRDDRSADASSAAGDDGDLAAQLLLISHVRATEDR